MQKITVAPLAALRFTANTIQSATGVSPYFLKLSQFKILPGYEKILKVTHQAVFYSGSNFYMVFSELSRLPIKKIVSSIKTLKDLGINLKMFFSPEGKFFISLPKNIDMHSLQVNLPKSVGYSLFLKRISSKSPEEQIKSLIRYLFRSLIK